MCIVEVKPGVAAAGDGETQGRYAAISGQTDYYNKARQKRYELFIYDVLRCKYCGKNELIRKAEGKPNKYYFCGSHRARYWQQRLQYPSRRRQFSSIGHLQLADRILEAKDNRTRFSLGLERARRVLRTISPWVRNEIAKIPLSVFAEILPVISPLATHVFNQVFLYNVFWKSIVRDPNEWKRAQRSPTRAKTELRKALEVMMSGPATRYKRTLEGISIRNLLLNVKASSKPHYFDDASILGRDGERRFDVLSPRSKALKELERSQSAVDLKTAAAEAEAADSLPNGGPSGDVKRRRPSGRRRLSTVGWWHESGRARQQLLEDALSHRIPNTFFTIHPRPGADKFKDISRSKLVFYVSETVSQSMNPDFRFFDASPREFNGSFVGALNEFVIKVWVQPNSFASETEDFYLLLEADITLTGLRKIAPTLDGYPHPFPANTVIFHMSDGVYVSHPDIKDAFQKPPQLSRASTFAPRSTSSFDELMKLSTTVECIDDAIQTRLSLAKDITAFLAEHKSAHDQTVSAANAPSTAKDHADAVADTKRSIKKLQSFVSTSKQRLATRRSTISQGRFALATSDETLREPEAAIDSLRASHSSTTQPLLSFQIQRIASTLLDIFPITPVAGAPLCFRIAGVYLPSAASFGGSNSRSPSRNPSVQSNSSTWWTSASVPEDNDLSTAAALGHAAFLVHYLATQLGVALPYPLNPLGSSSEVFDPLTPATQLGIVEMERKEGPTPKTNPQRVYVLSRRGSSPARFPWAVYLLNKDLEELARRCRLKVVDPRNTAANLKYVLEVLAVGGRGPAREKAGWREGDERVAFAESVVGGEDGRSAGGAGNVGDDNSVGEEDDGERTRGRRGIDTARGEDAQQQDSLAQTILLNQARRKMASTSSSSPPSAEQATAQEHTMSDEQVDQLARLMISTGVVSSMSASES